MKYRKKAAVVEARQVNIANLEQVAKWCEGEVNRRADNFKPSIRIWDIISITRAYEGDWIVKGQIGGFYVVKDDLFQQFYEPVSDSVGTETTTDDTIEFLKSVINVLESDNRKLIKALENYTCGCYHKKDVNETKCAGKFDDNCCGKIAALAINEVGNFE